MHAGQGKYSGDCRHVPWKTQVSSAFAEAMLENAAARHAPMQGSKVSETNNKTLASLIRKPFCLIFSKCSIPCGHEGTAQKDKFRHGVRLLLLLLLDTAKDDGVLYAPLTLKKKFWATLTLRIPNFQLKMPKTVALAQHSGTRVLHAAHGNPYH